MSCFAGHHVLSPLALHGATATSAAGHNAFDGSLSLGLADIHHEPRQPVVFTGLG